MRFSAHHRSHALPANHPDKPAQGDEAPHVKVDVPYRILAVKYASICTATWVAILETDVT